MDVPTPSTSFVLRNVRVFEPSGTFSDPTDVHVRAGMVDRVGRSDDGPANSLDGAGAWLMPGLVDCHAHLGCFSTDTDQMLAMSATRWSMEVARNARTLLELGITLVRDPASIDGGIRDGVATGAVRGPTLRVSGPALSQTGGHVDGYVPNLGIDAMSGFLMPAYPGRVHSVVDGPDEMRKVVRTLVRSGVDWIKICTTGGLLSPMKDHPDKAEFTIDEIAVAVAEASAANVPVAAHAYGGIGLTNAVRAGVRSIEHGMFLQPEQAELMAARDCWLVPTLVVVEELKALADAGAIDEWSASKVHQLHEHSGRQVEVARAAGVRIAVGSDLTRQGRNLEELSLLGRAGMPAREVLVAATSGGAELLGLSSTHGRIAPTYTFDAVLLDEDPSNLEVFTKPSPVAAIFQAGRVIRPHPRWREGTWWLTT